MAGATMGMAFRQLRGLFGGGSVVALEDGQLLARYGLDGDEAAFEALIGRHGPMVLTICRAVLRNEHDVEDAFQATFLILARKARSIRGSEALGGWLHRVAYRASLQAVEVEARRRRKEKEAAMARDQASMPDRGSELAALLHEEIDRLPEAQRLPVVLCDLEGLSYEEAARRLGWTVPRFRHRLAEARKKLKDRLARWGDFPLAVPPALVRAAVASATGSTPSAAVALLVHTLLKGMLMTRIKLITAASLAGLALASAGWIAVGGRPAEDPKPAMRPAGQADPKPVAGDAPAAAGLIDVRGIVLDPLGKPVAGAMVYAVTPAPVPESTTGPDGRFRLRVPHPADSYFRRLLKQYPHVVASSPGLGLNWAAPAYDGVTSGEVTIRLVEDGPAIEGRVLDLEGRAVAGATVHPNTIYYAEGGSLDPWITRTKDKEGRGGFDGLGGIVTMKGEVTTGADGRFRLTGLGRERVASLHITGPTIANTTANVLLRDGPGVEGLDRQAMKPDSFVHPSTRFDVVAPPTKPIEGTVRDKDTGKPIEGLTIVVGVAQEGSYSRVPGCVAKTDAQGRFRMVGLGKAAAYQVGIMTNLPGQELPYLGGNRRFPANTPALEPLVIDMALRRGVEIRGRVVDKATGKPAFGTLYHFTFNDNPNLGDDPSYVDSTSNFTRTDADGRYRIVTIPGRGVIIFGGERDAYRTGLGAGAIVGVDPKGRGLLGTIPYPINPNNYHALAEVRTKVGDESATVNLQVESAGSLELAVLDPEGRAIGDLRVEGTSPQSVNHTTPVASSTVELIGIEPGKPRRVTVFHDARKLVGSIWLEGDEAGRLTVRLRPWGSVVGRVVVDEDKPWKAKGLYSGTNTPGTKPEEAGHLPGGATGEIQVGKDGRFRVDGLMPGLKYAASVTNGQVIFGGVFRDVAVAPGEVKDLGDLKVKPPSK